MEEAASFALDMTESVSAGKVLHKQTEKGELEAILNYTINWIMRK